MWLARWRGAEVALKELHLTNQTDQHQQEVFYEAERLAALRHPCIIAFYGIVSSSPDCYGTVVEYVRMGSLKRGLRKLAAQVGRGSDVVRGFWAHLWWDMSIGVHAHTSVNLSALPQRKRILDYDCHGMETCCSVALAQAALLAPS